MTSSPNAGPAAEHAAPAQRPPLDADPPPGTGLFGTRSDQDDDRPPPDLPPLPADPRWRIEHLPMVTAAAVALVLCAASLGYLAGGPTAALGAAAGVLLVAVSLTMSTLAIAWADAVRPALIMPVGLITYVIKFALIGFIMVRIADNGWPGGLPMAWGIAGGVVALTAVQVWWVSRLARRRAVDRRAGP